MHEACGRARVGHPELLMLGSIDSSKLIVVHVSELVELQLVWLTHLVHLVNMVNIVLEEVEPRVLLLMISRDRVVATPPLV